MAEKEPHNGVKKKIYIYIDTHIYDKINDIFYRRKWRPTPVLLPGESHGQRSLVGYSPRDHKCQTLLSD